MAVTGEHSTHVASFSLTHVHYNPASYISYLCAWLALVPQGLCVVYVTLIWATREVEIMLMFAGQMGCEVLNFGLKRLIKEERPPQMFGKGYGMPSSHAQFITFFAVSVSLFLLVRHKPTPHPPNSPHTPLTLPLRAGFSMLMGVVAFLVAISRIYLNYHTPKQVAVGALAGASCAIAWFVVTEIIRRSGLLDWAMNTELFRLFRVRDLVVFEDLPEGGWQRWMDRRDASRREANKKTR